MPVTRNTRRKTTTTKAQVTLANTEAALEKPAAKKPTRRKTAAPTTKKTTSRTKSTAKTESSLTQAAQTTVTNTEQAVENSHQTAQKVIENMAKMNKEAQEITEKMDRVAESNTKPIDEAVGNTEAEHNWLQLGQELQNISTTTASRLMQCQMDLVQVSMEKGAQQLNLLGEHKNMSSTIQAEMALMIKTQADILNQAQSSMQAMMDFHHEMQAWLGKTTQLANKETPNPLNLLKLN